MSTLLPIKVFQTCFFRLVLCLLLMLIGSECIYAQFPTRKVNIVLESITALDLRNNNGEDKIYIGIRTRYGVNEYTFSTAEYKEEGPHIFDKDDLEKSKSYNHSWGTLNLKNDETAYDILKKEDGNDDNDKDDDRGENLNEAGSSHLIFYIKEGKEGVFGKVRFSIKNEHGHITVKYAFDEPSFSSLSTDEDACGWSEWEANQSGCSNDGIINKRNGKLDIVFQGNKNGKEGKGYDYRLIFKVEELNN